MNNSHDVFCPMPFIALDISSTGEVSYCCESQTKLPRSNPLRLSKLFHHEEFQRDRDTMKKGAVPIGCAKCFKSETLGLTSKRQIEKGNFKAGLFGSTEMNSQDELRFFSYRTGNNCNLTCIMCNSESSYKIAIENWKGEFNSNSEPPTLYSNEIDYDSFLDSIKLLYVGGGEPLRSKEFKDLLDYLVSVKKTDLTISFNTNLSSLPKNYVEVLKKFKSVYFSVSIDGYRKSLEYIRYPLKWTRLLENLKELQSFKEFRCGIHFTTSALNISSLPLLLKDLAHTWLGTHPIEFFAPILSHPNEQSLEILNISSLKRYKKELSECEKYLKTFKNIKLGQSIDNLLQYITLAIEGKAPNKAQKLELGRRLIRLLTYKDQLRGTSFDEAFPNLKEDLII